jgi:UDP-2,4-diacetamido-2,4,6-trideoxy-beta-L-altropyranose hydrolase
VRFAFRVDASTRIGGGHIMRCLTLADLLRRQGDQCHFYCHPQPGDRIAALQAQGYPVTPLGLDDDLPGDEIHDWLVADHYQLDAAWERRQRPLARRILVIDDLANRPHDADVLLDQNLREGAEARYRPLVPDHCRLLLGTSHVLLRPAFDRTPTRQRDGTVRHVFVYFGGNDQDNLAGRALAALARFPQLSAQVVLGPDHPHRDALLAKTDGMSGITLEEHCPDMAAAMAKADLALGVCGIAAWERCALGLPTLVCVTADNQREDALALHRLGAVEHLGESAEVDAQRWADALTRALAAPVRIARMGEAAAAVVAGHQANRAALLDLLHDG